MSTNVSRPQKDTDCTDTRRDLARDHYHDARFLGIDGGGAEHFWSIYHQAIVVVQDGEHATVDLPVVHDGAAITDLRGWVEYTEAERDWVHLRISGGLVDDLATTISP